MGKHRFSVKLTKCAALALVFGVIGGTAFSGANYAMDSYFAQDADGKEAKEEEGDRIKPVSTADSSVVSTDISDVIEQVMPSDRKSVV